MDKHTFRERLLAVMEKKDHWAWPAFTCGMVPKARLHIHFEQEYATYIRDFPVMVGRAYVQCPVAEVRGGLAENLYEEETGGLIAGSPHPELFLEYARGLEMDIGRFDRIRLLPGAKRYRAFLDDATQERGWEAAAAVVTIFVEGTKDERSAIEIVGLQTPLPPLEEHPLVKHYGMPVERLALTKAHRQVEGDHRAAAWKAILEFVPAQKREAVVAAMGEALQHWLQYRDEIAGACGIERGSDGRLRVVARARGSCSGK